MIPQTLTQPSLMFWKEQARKRVIILAKSQQLKGVTMSYQTPETHIEHRKDEVREYKEKFLKTSPVDKLKNRWRNRLKKSHTQEK